MPKVSVIIPTYNRAELLKQAVESVIKQTFDDYEIIIVDDGSLDHTQETIQQLIENLGEKKIFLLTQNHKGRSAARNKGISFASGEYISFLDDDDLYLPNKLYAQVNYLENNPEYGMVYSAYYIMDFHGNIRKDIVGVEPLSGFVYPKLISYIGNQICTPAVMIRTQVLDEVGGFDVQMDICEDLDLWRRVARRYLIGQIVDPLVIIRENKNRALLLKEMLPARMKYYQKAFNEDPDLSNSSYKEKLITELYLRNSIYHILEGNYQQSIHSIYQGIIESPLMLLSQLVSFITLSIQRRARRMKNKLKNLKEF